MAFGRAYNVELPDGSALGLRRPTVEEFEQLLPIPDGVLRFNPSGITDAGGCEFPHLDTGEQMVGCLGHRGASYVKTRAWGIEYNGRLVGAAGVDCYSHVPYPSYFINILDPQVWDKGIGTAVTTVVAHDTFMRGHIAVASGSHPGNAASHAMHFRVGFVQTADGYNPDERGGTYDEFVLPAPSGPKPVELTQRQTNRARRIYAARLGAVVFSKARRSNP